MKASIIARKRIIGSATNRRLTDSELALCGGIKAGPWHEVDEAYDGLKDELIAEFRKLNPTFHMADYELRLTGGRTRRA